MMTYGLFIFAFLLNVILENALRHTKRDAFYTRSLFNRPKHINNLLHDVRVIEIEEVLPVNLVEPAQILRVDSAKSLLNVIRGTAACFGAY